ncbi:MAG TPA: TIGR00299 family protein, partial [Dehalococcoidia bacterium]|nr:TIGR00299 family protein [Dehalococcoidia bacterium]
RETPTLGIRTRNVDRYVAGREMTTIQTDMGPVAVKVKLLDGRPVSAAPEPDEVGRVARETGRPFQEVYQRVTEEARRQLL